MEIVTNINVNQDIRDKKTEPLIESATAQRVSVKAS
jgi:hypothetical protein